MVLTRKREEKERTQTSQTGISNEGFTLLELIVVIFIISITLGIVLSSINTRPSLTSEAKRLSAILRYVLDEAISKKQTLTVTAKIPEKRLIYELPEGKKEEFFPHLAEIRQGSKGTLKDSELKIFFYPSGVKDLFIFILRDDKDRFEITLNPLSNRVNITAQEG